MTALLRHEENHKDRAGAFTAIENRLAALVERDVSRNRRVASLNTTSNARTASLRPVSVG